MKASPLRERTARWAPPALVAAAALAAFAPALSAGFVSWDDGVYVVDNPLIRGLGLERLWAMLTATRGGLWQPLTWLSFALDHAVWGLEPAGFHATNLLLHAASSVLVYAIGLRLLGGRPAPAAFAALFFALHPLRVESVAWVTERKGLLSSFFFLAAVLAHLAGRARAVFAALALALVAKATAVVLPVVLVILEIYPLRRLPARPSRWLEPRYRAVWRPLVPLFLLALASFTVAVLVGKNTGVISDRVQLEAAWRVDRAFYGFLFYPWKTLWPADLSPYYPPRPWFGLATWRSSALYAAMLALAAALPFAATAAGRRWRPTRRRSFPSSAWFSKACSTPPRTVSAIFPASASRCCSARRRDAAARPARSLSPAWRRSAPRPGANARSGGTRPRCGRRRSSAPPVRSLARTWARTS